jgi:hypothetical protein
MINMTFSVNPDQSIAAARRRSDRLLYADHVRGSLCGGRARRGGRDWSFSRDIDAFFFCFFVLPTSTTGELLGVALAFPGAAFADDAKGHHPFFFVVCFAGDTFA